MAYSPSLFFPGQEASSMSFSGIEDEYDPEFHLILFVWNRKPNSYLLVREKREKEEEENQRVFLVKQQLAEVFIPGF